MRPAGRTDICTGGATLRVARLICYRHSLRRRAGRFQLLEDYERGV